MKTKLKLKRKISVILLVSLGILTLLSSCANTENNDSITTYTVSSPNQNEETRSEVQEEFIPVDGIDYGEYKFRILGYDGEAKGTWQAAAISEVIAEKETGDPINDAVYRRNREVEALYNIEIDIVPVTYPNRGDFATITTKAIFAGDDLFDAALTLGSSIPTVLNQKNMVVDLLTVSSLDLSKSWWDQNSINELSIGGKLNAVIGDINLYSAFAAVDIFANKQLMQDYNIEDLYQLVRDGKWTWSKLHEIATIVTKDLDGNDVIDHNDQVGFATQYVYMHNAITSAGAFLTTKNERDIPEISVSNELIVSVIDKILPIFKDKECVIMTNEITGFGNVHFDCTMPKFRSGEIMFLVNQLMLSFELRSMDADFAVLPFPKYDEKQDGYGTMIQESWGTFTIIPTTCTDLERTGNILQAMGYYSQQYIIPAYYDITITNKIIRDEESAEMMDIILNNVRYDLSYYYNWGNVKSMFEEIVKEGSNTFVSKLEKNTNTLNSDIQKLLEALEED